MFEITQQEGASRHGTLTTRAGALQTPFFMPDATRASVRGLTSDEIADTGVGALVVNTYHLLLQPGEELIGHAGGIHRFMRWDRPILSDSGGYQVYSLIHKHPGTGKITEEGAQFRSTRDGSKHLLTPERAIQVQFDLGVDMMVCLDDPRPNDVSEEEASAAVDRTLRWAKRCREEYDGQIAARAMTDANRPLLFGVVQGGLFVPLRERCAQGLAALGFDGYGFGGRHIGEDGQFLTDILAKTAAFIPEKSIRFALGIGTPADIVRCFALGWDMFDCVIPTREGRHGRLFVWKDLSKNDEHRTINEEKAISNDTVLPDDFYETININNERFREDFTPIDSTCDCTACKQYSRAYIRHLFSVSEPLAQHLTSIHNLRFYARLMERLRK